MGKCSNIQYWAMCEICALSSSSRETNCWHVLAQGAIYTCMLRVAVFGENQRCAGECSSTKGSKCEEHDVTALPLVIQDSNPAGLNRSSLCFLHNIRGLHIGKKRETYASRCKQQGSACLLVCTEGNVLHIVLHFPSATAILACITSCQRLPKCHQYKSRAVLQGKPSTAARSLHLQRVVLGLQD